MTMSLVRMVMGDVSAVVVKSGPISQAFFAFSTITSPARRLWASLSPMCFFDTLDVAMGSWDLESL